MNYITRIARHFYFVIWNVRKLQAAEERRKISIALLDAGPHAPLPMGKAGKGGGQAGVARVYDDGADDEDLNVTFSSDDEGPRGQAPPVAKLLFGASFVLMLAVLGLIAYW